MAAIVAGNTVVLKPSSDSPTIAAKFIEVLEEIGLPKGVVNFITGSAETGEAMVTHPKTRFISFTGSKQVGLHINEEAAKTRDGQIWIKRVVAEMGGKDAIVVADDADLDAAATGVVQAAFGYQGQKCSACSRLIVDEKVHDELMEKVVALTKRSKIGQPTEGDTNVAAVINKRSFDNTLLIYQKGNGRRRKTDLGGNGDESNGFFIEPTIIDNVEAGVNDRTGRNFRASFGGNQSKRFRSRLEIANDTEFGLTGAVYSAAKNRLEQARREFHVGNLYLNRKCTGALVGVHPFGGFNMSRNRFKGRRTRISFAIYARQINCPKNMKKTITTILLITSMILPMFAQKRKPVRKTAVKPIIFAVLNDGRTLEPIVQVENGKIVELQSNAENGWKDFTKSYYKPKTAYN